MLTIDQLNNVFAHFRGLCVIQWGLPGSGKSTQTRALREVCVEHGISFNKVSTDDFFVNEEGVYVFDPSKIAENHQRAKELFQSFLGQFQVIVVDNTNMLRWEWSNYADFARNAGYFVSLRSTPDALNVEVCSQPERNTHNVPLETYKKRRDAHLKKPFFPLYAGIFFSHEEIKPIFEMYMSEVKDCTPIEHPHVTLRHNPKGQLTSECLDFDTMQRSVFRANELFISDAGTISLHGTLDDFDVEFPHVTLGVAHGVAPYQSVTSYKVKAGVSVPLKNPIVLTGLVSVFW